MILHSVEHSVQRKKINKDLFIIWPELSLLADRTKTYLINVLAKFSVILMFNL